MSDKRIPLRRTRHGGMPSILCARLAAITVVLLPGIGVWARPADVSAESPATAPVQGRYRKAAVLPISDEINDVTLESLQRRIAEAQQAGADLLVFEMDTPGGQLLSALKICKTIKNLPQHTVAWVNPEAYSAGAIISMACNEILMSRRSTIGDAMPILAVGGAGAAAVPEDLKPKMLAPLLEEVRDSARRNGYSLLLCESMIQPDMEVFWVHDTQTGQKQFVTRAQRDRLFGISATQPDSASQPVDAVSRTEWTYVTASPRIPEVKQPVVAEGELLTMSQDEAIAYGFAGPALVSDVAALQHHYGLAALPQRLDYTWSEDLTAWLTSPIIRGILLMVAMLAGYIELNHPGVMLPGVIALVFLALFLGAPYLAGLASVWAILLVAVGLLLLAVELFVTPGFGVAGVAGVVLLLVGLVASFIPQEWPGQSPLHLPTSEYAWTALRHGLMAMVMALAGATVGIVVLSRYFQRMPYLGRLVLANPRPQEVSLEDWFAELPGPGRTGVAVGPLRPAGKARFGDRLADVVAESDFIESGQAIEVCERVGNRIVVRKAANRTGPANV